jgi:DNA adenine methylase
MQSFLRWAGSKRLILPELRQFIPTGFKRYVEPFAGSACLFFDLEPRSAVLSDLNTELIATYNMLKLDVELVLECFRRLPAGEKNYYRIRALDPVQLAPAEAAARFLYLNRYCFNGLYRTNRAGVFNVPYGPPVKPLRVFEARVRACATLLKNATTNIVADFAIALDGVREGDFVYLDPPYVVDDRRVFAEYLPGSFSRLDLQRLAKCLEELDDRGAIFLLSYAESEEASRLVSRWHSRTIRTQRNIAGFTGARRLAAEVICSNRPLVVNHG